MSTIVRAPNLRTVLLASGVVLTMAMGVRHGFGFWMQPLSQAHGWTRETYSLALALQNLMWGVFGPFVGMAADRFGTAKVVIVGALFYGAGLLWMALFDSGFLFIVGLGGYLYARQGSYDVVWAITLLLGVGAALVSLPINERPIARNALKAI